MTQAKTLTKEHLEETRKSGHICSGMFQSIEDGECNMSRILSDGNIQEKLGFVKLQNSESLNNSDKSIIKNKQKPFERKPKRDIVG